MTLRGWGGGGGKDEGEGMGLDDTAVGLVPYFCSNALLVCENAGLTLHTWALQRVYPCQNLMGRQGPEEDLVLALPHN